MLVPWMDVDAAFADLTAFGRQMDALLGARTSNRPTSEWGTTARDADAYVFSADLPGVAKSDVSMVLEDGLLTVTARRTVAPPEGTSIRYGERRAFELSRTLRIPDDADGDAISATFDNGALTVRIPTRPPARRTIEVSA